MFHDILPIGEKDGKAYFINEVKRGLACNCVCSSCGSRLVARKGKIKIHHFAHHNPDGNDIICTSGFETGIHLAAKEIIESSNKIVLPSPLLGKGCAFVLI